LKRGLDSGDRFLQRAALRAAGRIGEPGLPLLKKGYKSGNFDLQTAALIAAVEIGKSGLPLLKKGYDEILCACGAIQNWDCHYQGKPHLIAMIRTCNIKKRNTQHE